MKYLKKFNTEIEYTDFTESDKYVLPNVRWVVDGNNVLYNPAESGLVYNMVDLGLPSGLLWADRNVGATSPEDAGLYFAYGDTTGYTAEQVTNGEHVFDKASYWDWDSNTQSYIKYNEKGMYLQPEDDAVMVHMGSEYRMPTGTDFNELVNYTTRTVIDMNNNEYTGDDVYNIDYNTLLKGVKIIGTNGNFIFIPYASKITKYGVEINNDAYFQASGPTGEYFGIIGHPFRIDGYGGIGHVPENIFSGLSIRGVCNK